MVKTYLNREQKCAMLGTSHQLWRSELSPAPEREEDVVELAYFLEPPMAAKIQWWRSATKTKSLYRSCWELNSKRITKLLGSIRQKRSTVFKSFFFRYRIVETESGTRVNITLDFCTKTKKIWSFRIVFDLFYANNIDNFYWEICFHENYQQPVTNVKKKSCQTSKWNFFDWFRAMTVLAFFGCALTAYSPALALFMVTIARDPVRIIVLIFRWVICTSTPTATNDDFNFSAFFWLLSLLFSSVVWVAVYPLKETLAFGLVFSIIFQELFRLALFALFYKADAVLKKLTENEETRIFANRHILAYGKTNSS